jgi:hypothetical protein
MGHEANSTTSSSLTRELVRNPYCIVTYDGTTRIVRFIRSSVPMASLEEAARHFGQAVSVINALGRSRIRLVIDLRQAPSKNEPQYETAMAEHRRQVAKDILRVAVLVRTAAGRLQVQRLGKADHIQQLIVSDEAEAIAYLTAEDAK